MGDFLPPLFKIATGLSFMLLLALGLWGRKAIASVPAKVTAFSLLGIALGFLLLSAATDAGLNRGATLFMAAGASFLASAVLVTVGLFLSVRSER